MRPPPSTATPVPLIKRLARLVPFRIRESVKQQVLATRVPSCRDAFQSTPAAPTRLDMSDLETLAREHPVEPCSYEYDPISLLARGEERARDLRRAAPGARSFLEVGAADAMTSGALAKGGARATAIDITLENVDSRARAAGVEIRQMDATVLEFPDDSFDCVFSYNTLEHLPDPEATLSEILRVLRPGGTGYLDFSALGWSPHGAHMYKQIGIPYVTVLFDEPTIDAYVRKQGLPGGFPWCNYWSIERYRALFEGLDPRIERVRYRETRNLYHLDFIERHAAHMKHAPSFDSLLVDSVLFVFRKK